MDAWPSVLIVDDEYNMRYFASELFQLEGVDTHTISDGCKALDYFDEILKQGGKMPRIVLLDMMMPCKSGLEVYSEVADKEWMNETTFIIVSAARDIELPTGHAPIFLLYKPYEVAALIDIAHRAAPELFNQALS